MNKKNFLIAVALLILYALWQKAYGQTILYDYVKTGLKTNLALKQQTFDLMHNIL